MDANHARHVTMVLDQAVPVHEVQAIEHFLSDLLPSLVGWAERLINRYHVADPAFCADDAVQHALLKFWRAVRDRKLHSIATEQELIKLIGHKLTQEVLDERDREGTRKRTRARADDGAPASPGRLTEVDLEAIDSHTVPPELAVHDADEPEGAMRLLDLFHSGLRPIAAKKAEGFTHCEIAAELDLSLSVVERRVRMIKAILGERYPDEI